MLRGFPDFRRRLQAGEFQFFPPYENQGEYVVLPDRLEIARQSAEKLDFSLELVRGLNSFLATVTYGVLDIRLSPRYRLDEALLALRASVPNQLVTPADFANGYLRIGVPGNVDMAAAEVHQPQPLSWNGIGVACCILRLSPEGITLVKRALLGEILLLAASAEVELVGLSPRLPLQVRFNPAALLEALLELADTDRQVAWEDLFHFFRREEAALPLEMSGTVGEEERDTLAEALVDRVRQRFGSFIASPRSEAMPYMQLVSPSDVGSGTFTWDLSQPLLVPRVFVLELDPMSAARDLVAHQGIESVIHETEVPPLQTGVVTVGVTANLPDAPIGVLQLGVDLFAPPHPPARVHPLTASFLLDNPEQRQSTRWRFSPLEKIVYQCTAFAIIKGTSGIMRLEGTPTARTSLELLLRPADFPLHFVTIQASASLLAQATIHGICRSPAPQGGGTVETPFTLSTELPKVSLSLPPDVVEGSLLEIETQSLTTKQVVSLGTFAAKGLRLDLFSFPDYGPHTIEIEGIFDQPVPLIAIDLLPEAKLEHPEEADTIALSATKTAAQWTYFATSPFRAGYVYRTRRPQEEPDPWSAVQSPFTHLQCKASQLGEERMPVENVQETIVIEGIELKAKDDSKRVWTYVPSRPTLERNQSGKLTLQVIEADTAAFLQCTARVALNEDARTKLLAQLREQKPTAEAIEAAPLSVDRITLEAKVGDEWVTIAQSQGSGVSPWTAAFSATLTAAQLSAVKTAVTGEKDHARIKAWIVLLRTPTAVVKTETRTEVRATTASGTSSRSFAATSETTGSTSKETTREITADIASVFGESTANH